jgi:penicillin-binding protein 1A
MAKKNKKRKSNNRSIKTGLIILWGLFIIAMMAMFTAVYAISKGWLGNLPAITELENPVNKFASKVYTHDNKLMGTWSYASANRFIVPYDSLPEVLVQALVDTEDERFFDHSGIDMRALGRVLVKRGFMGEESAGGGSTITQQLAKQLYSGVTAETTITDRMMQKPVEWYIATMLERYYTKEEILTMYLNYFDFLHNAVGIKNASRTYFGKDPIDLTLPEAATLVGMCKNPSYYNPQINKERMVERRNVVLDKMFELGHISEQELEEAKNSPLDTSKFNVTRQDDGFAPYFKEHIRIIMMAKKPEKSDYAAWQYQKYADDSVAWETDPLYGWCNKHTKKDGTNYNIYTDGLRIYTTLDSRMQEHAEAAAYQHVAKTLQPRFEAEKRGSKNAPYTGISSTRVESILWRYYRQTDQYAQLVKAGVDEDSIKKIYYTPVTTKLFSYGGEITKELSPRDSILYYKKFLRTAMMAMEPATGAVRAYVPGLDFKHFQYDNCLGGGRRQVGSTIKPYLYALAMMNGLTPCDKAPNKRINYGGWAPRNGSRAMYGAMVTLKWGLSQSNNWIAAWVMSQMNPHQFIGMLRQCGINTRSIEPNMTLCLGPCDISVGEMVSGYSIFPNYGLRAAPLLVERIEDSDGNVIDTFTPRLNEVLSKDAAYKMIIMLRGVVREGTATRIGRVYGIRADMGGKTGTTNSNADGWFMGFTPKLVVGCWVGGEDMDVHFTSMSNGQGAAAALPIYGLFMKKVYADEVLHNRYGISTADKFDIPENFDMCLSELTGLDIPEGGDVIIDEEDDTNRPGRFIKNGTKFHSSSGSNVVRRRKKNTDTGSNSAAKTTDSNNANSQGERKQDNNSGNSGTTNNNNNAAPQQNNTPKPVAPPPPPPPPVEGTIDHSFD